MRFLIFTLITFALFLNDAAFAQTDSTEKVVRNAIWFTPSKADVINGIALGIVESTVMYKDQVVNGITINILSPGMMIPAFVPNDVLAECFELAYDSIALDSLLKAKSIPDSTRNNYIHNGLVLSGVGLLTDVVHGVQISPWCCLIDEVDGVCINLMCNWVNQVKGVGIGISNDSYSCKGIQIGLINRSFRLNGFQIGLWNRNRKRSLPLINWYFDKF